MNISPRFNHSVTITKGNRNSQKSKKSSAHNQKNRQQRPQRERERKREMRTFQSQSRSSASSSPSSVSSTASGTLTALLILTIPVCTCAPAELQQAITDQRQLLSQIDAACSSYLSADMKIWASDVLEELCVLMLFRKSKEMKVQEKSKRFLFHYSRIQGPALSEGAFLNSIPEEREDSQCAVKYRDLEESRAEVTFSIGHEMEDDHWSMSKMKV
ncbi:hypothetical protein NQZ68_029444 [Dissostichus eleginoides]|nr:hypothetical protein NQZ68_029444 [Dissostichus eleginoides]